MSAATHEVFLPAGESLSGLWDIDDGATPTPAPLDPILATCIAWRDRDLVAPVDWSGYLAATGTPGQLGLEVPGLATFALGAGRWNVQVWAAFEVDTPPDVLIASIAMRLTVGLPTIADAALIDVSGVVL